jgi:lipopolysaccharide transport system permease protein
MIAIEQSVRSDDGARHFGLVWTLIRTDFKARYHGTPKGFVWALLKPLAMFVVLMAVFSFFFPDPSYKLNLILGLFLWDFFAEGTKVGLASLHAKGFLLAKARCPHWLLVVTSISNAAITLLVFLVIAAGFLSVTGHRPTFAAFALFAVYCLCLALIVIGFSLAASVLFLRYRDLNQVWDMVTQAGFFVAPIVYPLSTLPHKFHLYLFLWPPTPIIEFSRMLLVNGTTPTVRAHACLLALVAATLAMGIAVFKRFDPHAAEYV